MDSMTEAQFNQPMNPEDQSQNTVQAGTYISEQTDTDVVGIPTDQKVDMEIIQMVTSRKQASEDWRKPYRLEWDEALNNYEQIYDSTNKETWQATTFQPMTTTMVERSTASLHGMSMGTDAPVEFQARALGNEKTIENINEIIQYDLEMSGFKVEWADFCRTLSLFGTAIGKCNYIKEEATVMIKERKNPIFNGMFANLGSMFGFGEPAPTERMIPKKMLTRDFSSLKNCDLYKIYPQPMIDDITKDTWIIEKFEITNKELLEGARNPDPYYRLDNITTQLLMNGNPSVGRDPETQSKEYAQGSYEIPLPYIEPDLKHEVLEYWGPVPKWFLSPDLRSDDLAKYEVEYAWIWVVDGQWVVRKKLNPFIDACPPYEKGNYIRRPGQFYGIGNGKLLFGLQVEKNETRNTRQDNINLILNKIIAVLKDKVSKDEWSRLVSDPGAIWPFTGIDDVRKVVFPIDMPDITQDSWRASAEIDREAQEVTDVIKTTSTIGAGEDQAGNGTFRGQLLNHEVANERFKLYATVLEITALRRIISRLYQRIYQFKSYEQIEKIIGKKAAIDFELIPPAELFEMAKLISLGSLTTQNKGLQLAQMREFYALFNQEPFLKKIDYARKMYRLISSSGDPDEVLMNDEEIQTYIQFKNKLIIQQGGMVSGIPGSQNQTPGMPGMEPSGPIAGGTEPPNPNRLIQPPSPARGPGASPADMAGMPMS